jgi:streptogramin lyase
VSRVSAATRKRVAIKVGLTPYDATFAYGAAWATAYGGGELDRIDPARNRVVKRIPLPSATGVVGAFGSIWATGSDGVIRVDPATNAVVARIPLPSAAWTAASADAVWITSPQGLVRIDPTTNTIVATVPLGGVPLGDPAVVEGLVWVPKIRQNTVALVDPATNRASGAIRVGTGPFVVTEIRGEAWIPSWKGADIWRLRP